MSDNIIQLGTLARVQARPSIDADGLLQLARERAPDATVFDSVPPFFWQVRASSNRLDFYDTRMRAGENRTLGNFARALAEGVSYQDSHRTGKNGWGQSLTGRVVVTDEVDPEINEPVTEVWGELYTLPGLTLGEQSTDSMIAAIRAGIWRDVSVGFYARDIECSICGKQSFEWWKEDGCQHIPGYTYAFEDRQTTAFAWINDGELFELSQVYKGASPAAAVLKAEQMSEEGRLSEGERSFIERRHGVRLLEPAHSYALGSIRSQHKEADMPEDNSGQELNKTTRSVIVDALNFAARRAENGAWEFKFDEESDSLGDSVARFVAMSLNLVIERNEAEAATERIAEERDAAKATIAKLEPLAEDGRQYREHLITDTVAAGARAFGKDFREDMYRGIMARADIEQIRAMKEDFTRQGDALFASRNTVDDDQTPATKEGEPKKVESDRYRS